LFPAAGIILFLVPLIFNKAPSDNTFKELFDIKKAVRKDSNAIAPMKDTPEAKVVEMEAE